jgi:uroporphyrinogen-III decarboxylase
MMKVTSRLIEGIERIKKAGNGKPDRVPVYAQMSHHSAGLAGESTRRFFTDAETFLKCELSADELYGFDAPTIHYDCYNIEAEAVGAPLVFKDDEIPMIDPYEPLLKSVGGIPSLGGFRVGKSGRMPYVLEINRRLADLGLSPKIRFCGLFTFTAKLLGYEELIVGIKTNPREVHRLMRFLADEVTAPWIECQRQDSGFEGVATGSEALASPPLLTIDMMEEFCLEYAKRLEKTVGGIRLAGMWGESLVKDPVKLLDIKRESSAGMLQVCDPDVTELGPSYFKAYADEHDVGLIMGLDAHLIRSGPLGRIQERARKFIGEAGRDGRFILFINDIPYDTPPEHVHSVVSVAHEHAYH